MSHGIDYHSHYHSHSEYADKADLEYLSDRLRHLEDRVEQVRDELSDYVRTEISGLSDWLRELEEHSHEQVPAKAKGGQS